MRELLVQEVDQVSGGNHQGFARTDGQPFSWIGPNGLQYDNVTFVGSSFFVMDGFQEYYIDYFHVSSYPLPSLEGFLSRVAWGGSAPISPYPGFTLVPW
jgi:hypothetical protein